MQTAIYTEIIKINQKTGGQYADRLTRIISNAIAVESDAKILLEWLEKINNKLSKDCAI